MDLKINGLISIPKFFLSNNEHMTFVFIVDKTKVNSALKISLSYTDIYSKYTYLQHEQFNVHCDDESKLSYSQKLEDLLSKQEILNKHKKSSSNNKPQ